MNKQEIIKLISNLEEDKGYNFSIISDFINWYIGDDYENDFLILKKLISKIINYYDNDKKIILINEITKNIY